MIALAGYHGGRAGTWLVILATILFGALFAGGARADSPPQITVRASAEQVEVGEPFTIELKAMVDQGTSAPSDPSIRPPPGFNVEGPSLSTQTVINGFGARSQVRIGIGATWQLTAQRPGRYTIPAPTVSWNGRRLAGSAVAIEVVAASGRSRQRQPQNPFLMPGGPGFNFPWPFGGGKDLRDEDETPSAPELAMPTAPDRIAFVRGIVDKTTAVVGEQITLTFYTYVNVDQTGRMQLTSWHEAPLSDFMRLPLRKNPGTEAPVIAMAGGKKYYARLFDKVAIFPVKAGDLHIGSLRVTFAGARLGRIGDRESADIVVRVSEPPLAGRPPGYTLGDVGQFTLAATVAPRRIDQGGSVSVTLKAAGSGNLPQSLRLPERTGVEWLDPEKKDAIDSQNGVVQGERTFGYVVRIAESGKVDLGEVTLPYWNPAAKAYQVARVTLGAVQVKPVTPAAAPGSDAGAPAAADEPRADPFAAMPGVRTTLGQHEARARRLGGSSLWLLIAAPPLLVGAISMGSSAARRARARRAESSSAPAALAARALREADEAEARGDTRALTAAIDRAVHLAIEAAAGLKSRGVLLADLPDEIEKRGVPRALGEAAARVLSDCEAVRFEPAADGARTRELAAEARRLVNDLVRREAT